MSFAQFEGRCRAASAHIYGINPEFTVSERAHVADTMSLLGFYLWCNRLDIRVVSVGRREPHGD